MSDQAQIELTAWESTFPGMTPEGVKAEIDRLHESLSDQLVRESVVTDLGIRNGGAYAEFEGGAAHMLASHFAKQFEEQGGNNYFEMTLHPTKWKHEGESLVVTVRREKGETPHQLRMKAEASLTAALSRLTTQPTKEVGESGKVVEASNTHNERKEK